MANDDIQEKRLRARLALEGDTRTARREQSEAEIAKMRQEAMLAMEGNERKARRETKLKEEVDQAEAETNRLAEITKLKELEEARKKEVAYKALVEQQKITHTLEEKVEKIHQAEAKIEDLKQAPALSITSVRTLQSDLAQAVERRKMSATSIAIKNQEAPRNISFSEEPKSSPFKIIITILLIIILLGAGGGAIWYAQKIKNNQTVSLDDLNIPKLIRAENTEVINIATTTIAIQTKNEIKSKLANVKSGITNFYFTTQIPNPDKPEELITIFITPAKFTELAAVAIPDGVLRSVGDTFTLGVLTTANIRAPFIILKIKTDSADRALARMFDWEETMAADLADLWPNQQTTSSTTINQSAFIDKRINSRDIRILYNDNQEPVLLYTFFNNKYIIITTTDQAIEDLIARLAP